MSEQKAIEHEYAQRAPGRHEAILLQDWTGCPSPYVCLLRVFVSCVNLEKEESGKQTVKIVEKSLSAGSGLQPEDGRLRPLEQEAMSLVSRPGAGKQTVTSVILVAALHSRRGR